MEIPADRRYTKSHEWAKQEGNDLAVGITAHAQEELRDVVFVELPKVGSTVAAGQAVAVVESVKAAFDIYAPVAGKISRINDSVTKTPQLVNQDCYGKGWMFAVEPSAAQDFASLLGPEAYAAQLKAQAH